MKAVDTGVATPGPALAAMMDACLVCRACEDVCPSHVPFGRMMEAAREQVEPTRSWRARTLRWLAFHWVLPHPTLVRLAAMLQPLARPVLPRRVGMLIPGSGHPFARLRRSYDPPRGTPLRGTVALLTGCAQDRWYHQVNQATVRVLTRTGWRVEVPRSQGCCGALAAHNGRMAVARRLARRAAHAFAGAETVIVNAAGCMAHMSGLDELEPGTGLPVRELMTFLHEDGVGETLAGLPPGGPGREDETVAYHDACHALRVAKVHDAPRALLGAIPGLTVEEVPDGDRCCGAAGIHGVTQPEASGALGRDKAQAVGSTGARIVASANPGCSMQLQAWLAAGGHDVAVVHPVELVDRAMSTGT